MADTSVLYQLHCLKVSLFPELGQVRTVLSVARDQSMLSWEFEETSPQGNGQHDLVKMGLRRTYRASGHSAMFGKA